MNVRLAALLTVAFAAAFALSASAPASAPEGATERRLSLEQQVVRELNGARAAHGVPRLRAQPGLRAAAVVHTKSMLASGFFAHESPDGTPFHARVRRHYPKHGWQRWSVGETIVAGRGSLDARAVVASWLASPAHREIVLSPGWREVGIGAFYRPDAPGSFGGTETLAVTADFGLRQK